MEDKKVTTNKLEKKNYQSPELVEWGSVVEITLGGSGAPADGFGSGT